jgi:adenosine deaminase
MPLMPSLDDQIRAMPKVEPHVHLEGSLQPATLLALARRPGLGLADLRQLALNAARAAMLPAAEKQQLEAALLAVT